MVGPKKLKIFSSFNTLGNDPQVQVLAHLDNCAHFVRIPVKWAADSGDVGQGRSEATLVVFLP
jgi:hypothetical protein